MTTIDSGISAWCPVLDGALASRANATMEAIAEALRVPPPGVGIDDEHRAVENGCLAGGRAGLALLYSYLARTGSVDGALETAERFLDDAGKAVADLPMDPSLYGGFTGVAWAMAHLHDSSDAGSDDLNDIDEALGMHLARSPWADDYDLISGLAGIGVYALERLPRPGARELLALIVDRLDETAHRRDRHVTWFTAPELLPEWQRQLCPRGYYNVGLAHGVPGVIAVLAGSCAAGVAREKAQRLLDGAVTWLLARKLANDGGPVFPGWIAPGDEPRPARFAWCYGDPGIAAALLVAARAAGVASWEREAIEIARHAAAQPPETAGVRDAGICHGAAGLAHIFNRMFQATADACLGEAARFWFTRTLDIRQPGVAVGGYPAWAKRPDGTLDWTADPGLLSGAAGVALALAAAITAIEPAWDRMLLLSLPPHRGTIA